MTRTTWCAWVLVIGGLAGCETSHTTAAGLDVEGLSVSGDVDGFAIDGDAIAAATIRAAHDGEIGTFVIDGSELTVTLVACPLFDDGSNPYGLLDDGGVLFDDGAIPIPPELADASVGRSPDPGGCVVDDPDGGVACPPSVPDGSIDFGDPDGSIDFGDPDGSIDFGDPDGSIDFGDPDGSIDFGDPDGSIDGDATVPGIACDAARLAVCRGDHCTEFVRDALTLSIAEENGWRRLLADGHGAHGTTHVALRYRLAN